MTVLDVEAAPADDESARDEVTVLVHEMADDLDAYLASRPGTGPTSIAAVVAFNAAHADEELAQLRPGVPRGGGRQRRPCGARVRAARARNLAWAVDAVLNPAFGHGVDALISPAYGPAWRS